MDPEAILTVEDVRRAGYCLKGCRDWFKARNLDWKSFVRNGIRYGDLMHMNDAVVNHIVAKKMESANGQGQ